MNYAEKGDTGQSAKPSQIPEVIQDIPRLTQQAADFLARRRRSTQPSWQRDVADLRREMSEECRDVCGEPESVAQVEEVSAGGVRALLYRPRGDEREVVVWLHGGAFFKGDPECYDVAARALAKGGAAAVLSVDYRLAPEDRYPAAIDDCWSATVWAAERFDRIAIGGDSAGGNLAAAVALRARDRAMTLSAQVLVYPVLDYRPDSPDYLAYCDRYDEFAGQKGFGLTAQETMRRMWELYVPEEERRNEPDASPLRAESLAGVAPAIVVTAEHDILRGEAEEYVARLRQADVTVELLNYEGQFHGFFHLLGVMPDGRDAVSRVAASLRAAFRGIE
jgi:acetyl esterase/lipase